VNETFLTNPSKITRSFGCGSAALRFPAFCVSAVNEHYAIRTPYSRRKIMPETE
jgi:hypothetical protein